MISKLFYMSGHLESFARRVINISPKIKNRIKKQVKREVISEKKDFDENKWEFYCSKVRAVVNNGDILLIHSSMDGLNSIGVDTSRVLDFFLSFLEMGCTVVLPTYAASSTRVTDGRLKTYDPLKSPCWTGMLPNYFIRTPGVIRTVFPYNSLAAVGPCAEDMMHDNEQQMYVYGDHSAWKYCVDHHAKLLFIGTTSNNANTIQSHMIPDIMGDKWPIKDWYQEVICPVRVNGDIYEKVFFMQKSEWVKYIADYHITRKLEIAKILKHDVIYGCPFEYVDDAKTMVGFLVNLTMNGDMSYIVPRKYKKK